MSLYSLAKPFLFMFSPERAHGIAIAALKSGLLPAGPKYTSDRLSQSLWGLEFPNPIGLAAGFDKNAEVYEPMLRQGFGFVETGTVTPLPQPGNDKPRIFRLVEDEAVINRLGFNNRGLEFYISELKKRSRKSGIVGANVGANKLSDDPINDYVIGLEKVLGLADYFTINISSPNTPGLRKLQGREALDELLSKLKKVRDHAKLEQKPPLILKIAPDLDNGECEDIAEIILKHEIDGLIVSNTTLTRDGLTSHSKDESGGLSGKPLFDISTKILSKMYKLTQGRIPLIGVGGIANGEHAYAKIRAGASLVQLYSSLIYHGPALAVQVAKDLDVLLKKDGFSNVTEAIGIDHK
ncbi:MAG: quinone-dependent dihydroorotate dehydrogenase [Emcibacteraceae bacterium]|nr:quinone-dependent dihydroorotate dehydrogenase [Emcibacteraceae bacterium]